MSMQVKPVKPRRISASKIANDNGEARWSRLPWRQRAMLERRVNDLEWQLNFTNVKLSNWRDLDNGNWEPLMDLRDSVGLELETLLSN